MALSSEAARWALAALVSVLMAAILGYQWWQADFGYRPTAEQLASMEDVDDFLDEHWPVPDPSAQTPRIRIPTTGIFSG